MRPKNSRGRRTHDGARQALAKARVDCQEVSPRLAHRRGHDLDDPERQRDFRDFVEPVACSDRGQIVHGVLLPR